MGLSGKRIIVVEDDAVLALDVSEQLRSIGATILGPAPTPFYALQLIGSGRRKLDAAVLDIHLHGTTVYEFAGVLQDRGVPFLFATAYDSRTIPARFNQAPVLQKPVSPAALAEAVLEMVRQPMPNPVVTAMPLHRNNTEAPVTVFARTLARAMVQ